MAIGSTIITGDHADGYQDDAPCLYASRRGTAGRWNTDGDPATADASDADYPAVSAYDGHFAVITRPNAAAAIWWYVLTLDTTTVDAVLAHIASINLASGGSEGYIAGYISDGTTDHQVFDEVAHDGTTLYPRWFVPGLQISGDTGDEQRRFTGAVYLKLRFSSDAGTCRPQLTECSAGRARQMPYRVLYAEHDRARASSIREHTARSGLVAGAVDYAGAKVLNERYHFSSSDYADTLDAWWADTGYGARKSIWCPNPLTANNTAWLMNTPSKSYDTIRRGPNMWDAKLQGTEDGGSLLVDE